MIIQNKKNIQILTYGMRWQPYRLICEEISHCYSWKPVSNDSELGEITGITQVLPCGTVSLFSDESSGWRCYCWHVFISTCLLPQGIRRWEQGNVLKATSPLNHAPHLWRSGIQIVCYRIRSLNCDALRLLNTKAYVSSSLKDVLPENNVPCTYHCLYILSILVSIGCIVKAGSWPQLNINYMHKNIYAVHP